MSVRHVMAAGLAAAAASAGAAHATTQASRACPGPITIAGKQGYQFCGPASATLHLHGRTIRFHGGLCRTIEGHFTLNIGTLVPALRTGKPSYFGVTTEHAKAGIHDDAAVSFVTGGRRYVVVEQAVTLARGLRQGTFSGRILASATRVTGSFTC